MMNLLFEVIQYVIQETKCNGNCLRYDEMEIGNRNGKIVSDIVSEVFVTQYSFCRCQSPVNHFDMKLI